MFHLMNTRWMTRSVLMTALLMCIGVLNAADLDPKAIAIQLPKDIKWVSNPNAGAETAVLLGDPSKPGLYVILQKWLPHHNSRPHFHPNDRYVTVLSGTRSEEHTSELQSQSNLVCRLLLEKKK